MLPWIINTGLPKDSVRSDRNTWVHLIQPYVKNGDPPRIPDLPARAGQGPLGLFACPSFNPQTYLVSSNQPDCNPGILASTDFPPRQYYAQYGIITPGGLSQGSCTQFDPRSAPAGSDPLNALIIRSLAELQHPAEAVIITDGLTIMSNAAGNGIRNQWGCQAKNSHLGGGNHIFADGHAKWIQGNSERYLLQDPAGCWYRKYYTIDR
jgi:hypothetical protein